jgi:nucleotide-binding universal stress UspA family protein
MKTIVLGYDDTEHARRALARTAEFAEVFKARVVVVSVAPVLVGAGHGIGPIDPVDSPELHREQLTYAKSELRNRGIEGAYQLAMGHPSDAILDAAEAEQADLIVVGGAESGLTSRLFGDSVSGSVQRRAHCDVLVVH